MDKEPKGTFSEVPVFKYAADRLELRASEDGSILGFAAGKTGNWYVIINGQKWGPYDDVTRPCFTKDGPVIFYYARQAGPQWEIIKVTS